MWEVPTTQLTGGESTCIMSES